MLPKDPGLNLAWSWAFFLQFSVLVKRISPNTAKAEKEHSYTDWVKTDSMRTERVRKKVLVKRRRYLVSLSKFQNLIILIDHED